VDIRNLDAATPFTTKDGSTIRSLLDRGTAPVQNQSLAEATLGAGQATERHHHRISEELYYVVEGQGEMEIDGERAEVGVGDAILIPPGAWHQLAAGAGGVRILCCCAPPYSDDDTYFS
jgi:mannose-6-phosphate isomerase-like protein (cupin superfamily)